jgi:hypothetical protein
VICTLNVGDVRAPFRDLLLDPGIHRAVAVCDETHVADAMFALCCLKAFYYDIRFHGLAAGAPVLEALICSRCRCELLGVGVCAYVARLRAHTHMAYLLRCGANDDSDTTKRIMGVLMRPLRPPVIKDIAGTQL